MIPARPAKSVSLADPAHKSVARSRSFAPKSVFENAIFPAKIYLFFK
jgi:hypothetical protein